MSPQGLLLSLFLGMAACTSAVAQVSIGIGLPGVSIGINLPVYPDLVQVPGYPVYYAPQMETNFFFYDGLYWVYAQDRWYASRWYNGPWDMVEPNVVPFYVLRVPVRYYRRPPPYFGGWNREAPPRWGDHWGHDWERQHSGWDQWNRAAAPALAPLPTYQRQYSRDRYPSADQQQQLHRQNYLYKPHEDVIRHGWYQQPSGHAAQGAPAPHPAPTQHQAVAPQAAPTQHPQPQHQQQAQQPQHQEQAPQQQHQPPPQQQHEQQPQQHEQPHQQHEQQPPQQQHQQAPQQQPSGHEHGSQGQDQGESKQPKQEQGKDKGGDRGTQ